MAQLFVTLRDSAVVEKQRMEQQENEIINMDGLQEWPTSLNGEFCFIEHCWVEDRCSVDELALPGGPGPGLIIPTHIT